MARSTAFILLLAFGMAACGPIEGATPRPSFPGGSTFDVVAPATEAAQNGSVVTYRVADGSEIRVDTSVARKIHVGAGDLELLVVGSDPQGQWWALVGTQDGMPADCLVLNEEGTDWGATIEVGGVAWPKAPAFTAEMGIVAPGTRYPFGTRFCLDTHARVVLATNR